MISVPPKRSSQAGVSLVELLVVIMVIAIVASFAIIGRGRSTEAFQLHNAAYGLKNAFERARFDSVKRRPDSYDESASVRIAATSHVLRVDRNGSATLTSDDDITTDVSIHGVTITLFTGSPQPITAPITIRFNLRGEPLFFTDGATNPSAISPVFCLSNAFGSMTVLVTPAGTVNILNGCGGVPEFFNPGVSAIPPTDLINDLVSGLGFGPSGGVVPTPPPGGGGYPTNPGPTPPVDPGGSPTPGPTGSPGPSPTGTPAPTPTGSPTPSPSPDPSATPTPTPMVCVLSAPSSVTFDKNSSPGSITVGFMGSSGNTISWAFTPNAETTGWGLQSPTSVTPLGSSGSFTITVTFPNGNQNGQGGTIQISGCGSATITVSGSN